MKVYIDGALYAEQDARVPALGDGFLAGRGVRDYFVCREGTFFHLDERLAHLKSFSEELQLPFPWAEGDIKEALASTYDMNGFNGDDALMTLILSAGSAPQAEACAAKDCEKAEGEKSKAAKSSAKAHVVPPSLIILAKPCLRGEVPGAALVSMEHFPLGSKILQWERYTLGCSGTAFLQSEVTEQKVDGAILLGEDKFFCGCTKGDLFLVQEKNIISPLLDRPGIVSTFLHPLLTDGDERKVVDQQVRLQDIASAKECFCICRCGKVVPVLRIDETPIGDGKMGPVTKIISANLSQKIKDESKPVF
jgi:branched-chain amino acid aminotransferase